MMTAKTEKVQISLYASNLKNVAGTLHGNSDPYAVVTVIASELGEVPKVLGKTEVIEGCLSPHWVKSFETVYHFSKATRINVGIYDAGGKKVKNGKKIGDGYFELGEVLGGKGVKAQRLKIGGTVFCRIQKVPEVFAGTLHLQLQGVKLKNVDGLFNKSDPFFEISKQIDAPAGPIWHVVYRSEVVKNDLNPKWKAFSIGMNELCDGDNDKPVLITILDWDRKGKYTSMGSIKTDVNSLVNAKVHPGTGDKKSIDTSKALIPLKKDEAFGKIVVTYAMIEGVGSNPPDTTAARRIEPITFANGESVDGKPRSIRVDTPLFGHKFLDYIAGGLELQLSVAIDFTGSNGDPHKPGSLHYVDQDGGQLNDYEKALTAVGEIVAKYDSDQKFPMLGFGAKFDSSTVNHCFQLGPLAEVSGVMGMLEAYRGLFKRHFTMSGPTVFAEVIDKVAAQARSKQEAFRLNNQQAYHILLILTDGCVTDILQTKRVIGAAADAPLSIVIVGIGNADFSAMQFLDDFQKEEGGRDICQFVEFQRHQSNNASHIGGNSRPSCELFPRTTYSTSSSYRCKQASNCPLRVQRR